MRICLKDTSFRRGPHDSLIVIRAKKSFAGWWIFFLGIYLLLVGKMNSAEIAAGLVAAALAAAALTVLATHGGGGFEFRAAWLVPLVGALGNAIRGSRVMLMANCSRLFRTRGEGRFDSIDFDSGNDSPSSKGRRALVIAAMSLAPDSFVLQIDRSGHRLVLHHYGRPASKSKSKTWPL